MLAEIHFLRLETLMRASEEAARAEKYRFVPISRDAFKEGQVPVNGRKG
jgi:hypothetical protein